MKKFLTNTIKTLKDTYPNEKIGVSNGFIGIESSDSRLKHTTYIGIQYYEIDGVIYEDNGNKSKKITKI